MERHRRIGQHAVGTGLRNPQDFLAKEAVDPQGHVATWNRGAEAIKGWTASEIIGEHFSRFYPSESIASGLPERELTGAARDGRFDLAATPYWQAVQDAGIVSGSSSHADRIATIREVERRYGLVVDPHTADGLHVGVRLRDPAVPLVAIETALPAKFAATIDEALGRPAPRPAPRAARPPRPGGSCRSPRRARSAPSAPAPRTAATPS